MVHRFSRGALLLSAGSIRWRGGFTGVLHTGGTGVTIGPRGAACPVFARSSSAF
jgi:hypothetical protein